MIINGDVSEFLQAPAVDQFEPKRVYLLAFEEVCINREGIYVEHGNQYAEKVNRVDNLEEPLDPKHEGQLAIPAGSRFVIEFFNRLE